MTKINLYSRRHPDGYFDDIEIGFYVTDGEHYQKFCVSVFAPRFGMPWRPIIHDDRFFREFNRRLCYKTQELIKMFQNWEQFSPYITEIWTLSTGGFDVRHYPKPPNYWTVDRLS
jgi:hypothetical protein